MHLDCCAQSVFPCSAYVFRKVSVGIKEVSVSAVVGCCPLGMHLQECLPAIYVTRSETAVLAACPAVIPQEFGVRTSLYSPVSITFQT